jgi:hypothetical protein
LRITVTGSAGVEGIAADESADGRATVESAAGTAAVEAGAGASAAGAAVVEGGALAVESGRGVVKSDAGIVTGESVCAELVETATRERRITTNDVRITILTSLRDELTDPPHNLNRHYRRARRMSGP